MPTMPDAHHDHRTAGKPAHRRGRLARRILGRRGIAAAVSLLLLGAVAATTVDRSVAARDDHGPELAESADLSAQVSGGTAGSRLHEKGPGVHRHRWRPRRHPRPVPTTSPKPSPSATATSEPTETPTPTDEPTSESSEPPVTATPTTAPSSPSTSGFPDASTTGPRGALTPRSGDLTITEDGTVIENVELHGSILVKADDVTIRNSKIVSDGFWPVRTIGKGLLVEDTTIVGSANSQASLAGNYFVGRRLNLYGAPDGIKMTGGGEIYDSYIHDLADFNGAHNDGIDAGGPVKIVHNTVLVQMGQTSAIMLSEYGTNANTGVLVKNNLIGGGGYTFYGGAPDPAQGHVVIDNLFTTRFFPLGGYWGPVAYWRSQGNTWSNNRWADGPSAGQLVNP